jgi:hypothetical protein
MPASPSGGSALAFSVCTSSSPSSRAAIATGGGARLRPRPDGRSGWLTTIPTSIRPRSTRRRSTSAPNGAVPK